MADRWYYARDSRQCGPISYDELKKMFDAGQLHPQTLVWQSGMKEWSPARTIEGLVPEAAPARPSGGTGRSLEEDEFFERFRRRERRGMSTGTKVALIVGGIVGAFAVLFVVGLVLVLSRQATPTGPRQWTERLGAGETKNYYVTFTTGRQAEFSVSGDGSSQVHLYVYDSTGWLEVSDTGPDDVPMCHWWPRRNETYRIEVVNRGMGPNTCVMRHN
jgi:hypothetical protein